jgi:hypothetical protein
MSPTMTYDWSKPAGPAVTGVVASFIAADTAAAVSATGGPAWVPLAAGAAVGTVHGMAAIKGRITKRLSAARAAMWLGGGALASVAVASDPGTWAGTGWWCAAASALVYGVAVGNGTYHAEICETAAVLAAQGTTPAGVADAQAADKDLAQEWMTRIKKLSRQDGIRFLRFERFNGGFHMSVLLPEDGSYKLTDFQGLNVALAESARLPLGCTVTIGPCLRQGEARLTVELEPHDPAGNPTVDSDLSELSVVTGIPIGYHRDGTPAIMSFRESGVFIVAPPKGGKTTLLKNIYAGLARCRDVVLWGIEVGKAGKDFDSWDGDGTAPLFAHKARTVADGLDTLKAARRVSQARITHRPYLERTAAADMDGSLLVDAQMPQILIIIDEGLSFITNMEALAQLKELNNESRESGIRVLISVTDANISSLPDSGLYRLTGQRIAMTSVGGVTNAVQRMFGGRKLPDLKQMTGLGIGLYGDDSGATAFRTVDVTPTHMRTVTAGTVHLRGRLDQVSAEAAFGSQGGAAAAPEAPARRPSDQPINQMRQPAEPKPSAPAKSDAEVDQEFQAIVGGLSDTEEPADGDPMAAEIRRLRGLGRSWRAIGDALGISPDKARRIVGEK